MPVFTPADRHSAALPFAVLGVACVVAGGLVAAATAPAGSEHGAWAAAYLVLVAGVAQVTLGVGQALLAPHTPPPRIVAAEFTAWNAGNAAVLTGTLAGLTPLVDAGGALLVVALALLSHSTRATRARDARARDARASGIPAHEVPVRGGRPLVAFRLLVAVLLVSIPVGLLLARIGPA